MTETLAEATGKENTEIVDKKVINKESGVYPNFSAAL